MSKQKTTKTPKIEAKAIIMGRTFKSSGKTPYEAISGLKIGNLKGKVILKVGDRERIVPPHVVNRLFHTQGLTREIALKQISNTF